MYRKRVARAGLLALMVLLVLNLLTVSPLLAIWIGSQVQGSRQPTMAGFLSAAAVLVLFSFILLRVIALVSRTHDKLAGHQQTVRSHAPWLRSMRGERASDRGGKAGLSALDVMLVSAVVVAVVAFEWWFFLESGSPIDERSGRDR